MVAISSISSTNLSAIRQAQANVASADDYARSLQSMSREAERALNQAQANADSIAAESDQAQAAAVSARQRLAAIGSIGGFIDTMA
jgi:hypothetical protein